MPNKRIFFDNESGIRLAGILDLPDESPHFFTLFSHCFTCSKDLKAIVKISRELARLGIGVLRFDFTGLGNSGGEFSETNFETNLADVAAAFDWLTREYQAPSLLMGLSLGGAAMLASVHRFDSVRAVATLAAPSCTKHLAEFLAGQNPEIESVGEGEVSIGGQSWSLRQQLLDSLRAYDLESDIRALDVHHLILHSPLDETLGFYHAERLFEWSGGVKSFVTLNGADHLMIRQPADVEFVAQQIELWSRRWR